MINLIPQHEKSKFRNIQTLIFFDSILVLVILVFCFSIILMLFENFSMNEMNIWRKYINFSHVLFLLFNDFIRLRNEPNKTFGNFLENDKGGLVSFEINLIYIFISISQT